MPGAGGLKRRLSFYSRPTIPDDGYGNVEGGWRLMFEAWARVQPRRGSETVIASRLAGVQPYTITIRWSDIASKITPGWRAVDSNTDETFNLRATANIDEKRRWIEIIAEGGVPT